MRNFVIAECHRIADLLGEYIEPNWNNVSNKQLLEIYGDLRIDLELEDIEEDIEKD